MKKIYIGLTQAEKTQTIKDTLPDNITNIVYFSKDGNTTIDIDGIEVENRSWDDAIKYKYFYPLLDKINNNYLIIFDDMMRTQKRNDLTYNCCHHYVNQTDHVLVFETFPIIETVEDYMILIDYLYPNRFKGQPFSQEFLGPKFVSIKPYTISLKSQTIPVDETKLQTYEDLKDDLFTAAETGKDPNTIPRELHIWAGTNCKKEYIEPGFIARNRRFKGVKTYKDKTASDAVTLIDFPVKQIQLNDFIKNNDIHDITFLNTELSVDKMYFGEFKGWIKTLNEVFYA